MTESPPKPETATWRVEAAQEGHRVDTHVALQLQVPRNRVQHWIRDSRVSIDDCTVLQPSRAVRGEQIVTVRLPPPLGGAQLEAEPGDLDILYEDQDLIFVDKPAGLVVHPGSGHETGTLCHRLLAHAPEIAAVGHSMRPGIVHRLDAGTSGVMVVARTPQAYDSLCRAFADRSVDKLYLAVAHGVPRAAQGEIDQPIGRHRADRKRMAVTPGGRSARTRYRVLAQSDRVCLLGLQILTGRTHQIRVHLKHVRHPLIGDPVYGEDRWKEVSGRARQVVRGFPRPALHAWRLRLAHPRTGKTLTVVAPPPEDLCALWQGIAGLALPLRPPEQALIGPP